MTPSPPPPSDAVQAARLRRAAWFAVTAVIGAYLMLSLFVQPQADDWSYARKGRDGWLAAQAYYYFGWNGRFTATALQTALGVVPPLFAPACRLAAGLLIAAFAAAAAALAAELAPRRRAAARLAACGAVAVYLCTCMPREGFYWMAGGLTYESAAALTMAGAAGALRLARGGAAAWLWAAVPTAGFLAAGCCETIVPLLALGCAAGWWRQRREPRAAAAWAALALGVLAGAALVVAAPGNRARVESVGGLRPLAPALWPALAGTLGSAARLASAPAALAALVVAALALAAIPAEERPAGSWRLAAACLALGLGGAAGAAVPALLAIGAIDPHVFDLLWWWLVLWTALAVAAALPRLLGLPPERRRLALAIAAAAIVPPALRDGVEVEVLASAGAALVALLALASALLAPRLLPGLAALALGAALGAWDAWGDLVSRGPAYAAVWSRRWSELAEARGRGDPVAVLSRLPDGAYPRTLACVEVQPLPGTRWNPDIAAWAGVREVWLESPAPPDHPLSASWRARIDESRRRWSDGSPPRP